MAVIGPFLSFWVAWALGFPCQDGEQKEENNVQLTPYACSHSPSEFCLTAILTDSRVSCSYEQNKTSDSRSKAYTVMWLKAQDALVFLPQVWDIAWWLSRPSESWREIFEPSSSLSSEQVVRVNSTLAKQIRHRPSEGHQIHSSYLFI